MLINGIRGTDEGDEIPGVGPKALFVQGIATSIDALSVGFTISEYDWLMALVCSPIIAIVTFFICMTGLSLGKRFEPGFPTRRIFSAASFLLQLVWKFL